MDSQKWNNAAATEVWAKCPGSLLKKPALLECDQFRAHITEATGGTIKELNTQSAVIAGGLTTQLHPLDVLPLNAMTMKAEVRTVTLAMSMIVVTKIFWGSITNKFFMLYCYFV
jgi:hypothetical protein